MSVIFGFLLVNLKLICTVFQGVVPPAHHESKLGFDISRMLFYVSEFLQLNIPGFHYSNWDESLTCVLLLKTIADIRKKITDTFTSRNRPLTYLAINEGNHKDKLGNATVSARATKVSHRYGKLALYIRPTETSSPTTLFR